MSKASKSLPTGSGSLPEFIGIDGLTDLFSRDFSSNLHEKATALSDKIHRSAGITPRGPCKVSTAGELPPEQLQGVIEASALKPKAIANKLPKSPFTLK